MPTTLPPVHINHRLVFTLGTLVWALALAVTAVLFWAFDQPIGKMVLVCATGTALGVVGLIYVRHSWRAQE
ncbi:MAG: DUF2530 domain-containing protein [Micrococcales bacterium]|nr:DUF2530 domain-containing protein [Micrococcales bacterium]